MSQIQFRLDPMDADLFSTQADIIAKSFCQSKNHNKSTQLRKFYNELTMWNTRVQAANGQSDKEFKSVEPFIKMLNAKAAYSQGRNHVDQNFTHFIKHGLEQVKDATTLLHFKLLFEAVLGYHKSLEK